MENNQNYYNKLEELKQSLENEKSLWKFYGTILVLPAILNTLADKLNVNISTFDKISYALFLPFGAAMLETSIEEKLTKNLTYSIKK